MEAILEVKNLTLTVPHKVLFENLSFAIPPHTLTCITGENGVGKTTLMKYLLKSLKKHQLPHTIITHVKPDEIQYVPQLRNLDEDYPLCVKDFINLGFKHRILPWNTKAMNAQLEKLMKLTNVLKIQKQSLGKASGGEKQRAFLAQALCAEPKLLILDEVTANLDHRSKHELLALLKKLIGQLNLTVIFISHDRELIDQYADYELQLAQHHGKLLKRGEF